MVPFLVILTQLTDFYTTYLGITKYHSTESNQLMADVINNYGMGYFFIVKLLAGCTIAYFLRESKWACWIFILVFAYVSIHNITVFS